jgi:hypothetical protein
MPTVTTPPSAIANSYTSVAEADAYFEAKPGAMADAWRSAGGSAKEAALIEATTILESYPWVGVKTHALASNALSWPRDGVYNRDGQMLPSDVVPAPIKRAAAELAQLILAGTVGAGGGSPSTAGPAVTQVTVGDISLSYEPTERSASTGFDSGFESAVDLLIAPFVNRRAPTARLAR